MAAPQLDKGKYIQGFNTLQDLISKLDNTRQSIYQKDPHPDRIVMLDKPYDQYSDYEKTLLGLNPDIAHDQKSIGSINDLIGKLKNQQDALKSNYFDLYGTALQAGQDINKGIQEQTKNLLAGAATEELRNRGYALGETSKKGDTAGLREKAIGEAAGKAQQERLNTLGAQENAIIANNQNQQNIIQNTAKALQDQAQFEAQQAAYAASRSGGGGGSSGGKGVSQAELDALKSLTGGSGTTPATTDANATTPGSYGQGYGGGLLTAAVGGGLYALRKNKGKIANGFLKIIGRLPK